ncbi:hypothetical protein NQ314_019326, partial [Rhamnusium bicolor]
ARLPIETLENYVLDCFANVPNNGLPPDDFKPFAEGIFDTPEFNRLYYVKPTKDLCQVDLTWCFPCLRDKYKSKPHQYISQLLGDEGKGSVLSYLRKKVWGLATSIGNGETGSEHNSLYALFTVTVVLTAEGLIHLYEAIKMLTNLLRPEKMNVMVMTNTLPNSLKYEKVEKWFGTEYTDTDIPQEWIKKWQSVEPFPELDIPSPNPYLTTDFSILPDVENHPDYPQKVLNSALLEMWYRKDQKFKLPLAYYNFYLISPLAIESVSSPVLLDMLINLLVVAITEEVYPATNADLFHNFSMHEKGFMIKVSGYNEKLPLLIEVISEYLVTIHDHLTEDMFDAVKDKVIKSYYNKVLKPSTLAK